MTATVPTGQGLSVPSPESLLPLGLGDGVSFSIWTERVSAKDSKKARVALIGLPAFIDAFFFVT